MHFRSERNKDVVRNKDVMYANRMTSYVLLFPDFLLALHFKTSLSTNMPWWSLNIDYVLQRGWLLLLQRMRSGRANSAGHINVIFLRHSCNLPSCNYIIWHLSALFPKSE